MHVEGTKIFYLEQLMHCAWFGFHLSVIFWCHLISSLIDNRGDVIPLIVKSLKSPRSAVCKTAIMTSADVYKVYRDLVIDALDPMVLTNFILLSAVQPRKYSLLLCPMQLMKVMLMIIFCFQLVQLLLKSSQDKRFVCEAAETALIAMTTWISPALLLPKLLPYFKNRNPRIRAKTSMCFSRSVARLVSFVFFWFELTSELVSGC